MFASKYDMNNHDFSAFRGSIHLFSALGNNVPGPCGQTLCGFSLICDHLHWKDNLRAEWSSSSSKGELQHPYLRLLLMRWLLEQFFWSNSCAWGNTGTEAYTVDSRKVRLGPFQTAALTVPKSNGRCSFRTSEEELAFCELTTNIHRL